MNYRKIIFWTIVIAFVGAGFFFLGRLFASSPEAQSLQVPPAYSISQGPTGMVGGGAYYVLDYGYTTESYLSLEDLLVPVQRYLDQLGNADLIVARLREFRWAYQVEIVERSTGHHAFGFMLGKGMPQISPKAGPNIFWNTRYGDQIAEVGGGYGMLERLLSREPMGEMSLSEVEARRIAEATIPSLNEGLA